MDRRVDSGSYREIGRVVAAKGVRGELKIAPDTDDPSRLLDLRSILIGDDVESSMTFDIESAFIQPSKRGPTVVVALRGITERSQAEKLRKSRVFVSEAELPDLRPGEYFISDLIGSRLETEDGQVLGELVDVLDMPAQQVWVARLDDSREILIPAVPDFVKEIDLDSRRLVVALIDGLL